MRWQHAMMPVADQPDVLPDLTLSDPGDRSDATAEYVDRSEVGPSIVTPDGMSTRRSWRSRLRRAGAVVVVMIVIAGTAVGARLVLLRLLAEDEPALAVTPTDQKVGPVSFVVPDGLERGDCIDPPVDTTCVQWEATSDDTVFLVEVFGLRSRVDEMGLAGVAQNVIDRIATSRDIASTDPVVTVDADRTTVAVEISVDGEVGRLTVVAIGRWIVAVSAAGPDDLLEWHDTVVASVRRS